MMFMFLDLPREIRDMLYLAVLTADATAPPPSEIPFPLRRTSCAPDVYLGMLGGACNRYLTDPVSTSSAPLLLTSRQVRRETWDALDQLKRQAKLTYKIDCAVENEELLYPTWTYVPVLSMYVDKVEADVRVLGGGDRSSGHMVWSLLELLDRFLERGPNFAVPLTKGRPVFVGTLSININSPLEPEKRFVPKEGPWWNLGNEGRARHPESIQIMITEGLDVLLRSEEAGKNVRRGIGKIELALDGDVSKLWDVEEWTFQGKDTTE